jgi:hypothetical protein
MQEPRAVPGERPRSPSTEAGRRAPRSRGHVWLLATTGILLAALALLRWYAEPVARGYGTHVQFGLPPCTMMAVTGLPCPGCGVTTSMSLSVHGRWLEALANQPFGVLVVLGIPLFALWALWGHVLGRDRWIDLRTALRRRAWLAAIAVLGLCWLWKVVQTV